MVVAGTAFTGAFSQNPGLWPTEFWRWSGVGLDCLTLIGGLWGFLRLYTATKK
ncbi:MAG: hypothetical protein ACI9WC_003449 [Arenicella sp.]|jgi:hypothetical protein